MCTHIPHIYILSNVSSALTNIDRRMPQFHFSSVFLRSHICTIYLVANDDDHHAHAAGSTPALVILYFLIYAHSSYF